MDFHQLVRELDALTAQGVKELDPEASAAIAAMAIGKAAKGKNLSQTERDAIADYAALFEELLRNPSPRRRLLDMQKLVKKKKEK
jgi:hypothetical protein